MLGVCAVCVQGQVSSLFADIRGLLMPNTSADQVFALAQAAAGTGSYAMLTNAVATVLEVPREYVHAKTISASNMTSPRVGEFGTKRNRWVNLHAAQPTRWVLVGLLSGVESDYSSIAGSLVSMLRGVATTALLIGMKPQVRSYKVFWSVGHEADRDKLVSAFGVAAGDIIQIPASAIGAGGQQLPTPQPPQPPPAPPFDLATITEDLFISPEEFEQMLSVLRRRKNVILQGPPGVGKTMIARRLAYALLGEKTDTRVGAVQFHQTFSYEDFVQGWRPDATGGFSVRPGLFTRFCVDEVQQRVDSDYVYLIDEINRANLAKVFGELMTLLEADKRGPEFAIPLLYSTADDETFFVPANLYVIGMMNTADRSLAMVDFALRRRFAFFDLRPAFDQPRFQHYLDQKGVAPELSYKIITRMGALNSAIAQDSKNLGTGFEIGHSFFCDQLEEGVPDEEWYRTVIKTEIGPLLREYWFDDDATAEAKVQALLA